MKHSSFLPLAVALLSLLLVSMACNLFAKSEPTPAATIPVSTQAVESLEKNLQQAGTAISSSGQTTLTINEEQLTSLVATELQKQETPIFRDPQVYLRDGQIKILGKVQQGDAEATLELVLTVSVNSDGRPEYKLVSAKIGPLPLPDAMVQGLSVQLDSAFKSNIDPQMDDIYIDKITIADGVMTIQGHKR